MMRDADLRSGLNRVAMGYDNGAMSGWNPVRDIERAVGNVGRSINRAVNDVGDFIGRSVAGLDKAYKGVSKSVFEGTKQFGETLALTARASVGDVKWSEVSRSAGKVVRQVANVHVLMNPARFWAQVAQESTLTRQAFKDVDLFTGGMLTSGINVSDVVQRSIRGDAITKEELIRDAMFALQVLAAVATGGSGAAVVGGIIGTMVGQQVCSKQTKMKNECMVAFQLLGTFLGSWGAGIEQAVAKASLNQATKDAVKLCASKGWAGNKECEILGNLASSYITSKDPRTWEDFLLEESKKYGVTYAFNKATEIAIDNCRKANWTGDKDCDAIGNMMSKYLLMPEPRKPWEDFVTEELASRGLESLVDKLLPKPEVILPPEPSFDIVYADVPGQTVIYEQKTNPALFLVLAAGAALFLGVS